MIRSYLGIRITVIRALNEQLANHDAAGGCLIK